MATDLFLKIPEVPGESTDKLHQGSIEISSFSWGVATTSTISSGGKAVAQNFSFTAPISKASPPLFLACATGQHYKDATLIARRVGATSQDFLSIKLTDVLVSSYQTGGRDDSDVPPTDQISFAYGKVEVEYKIFNSSGAVSETIRGGFDFRTGVKV